MSPDPTKKANWRDHVLIAPRFFRAAEVQLHLGDPRKAIRQLGWEPIGKFNDLVEEMVRTDVDRLAGVGVAEVE